eukprot:5371199-Heterocapsa_arctica.AAC.1
MREAYQVQVRACPTPRDPIHAVDGSGRERTPATTTTTTATATTAIPSPQSGILQYPILNPGYCNTQSPI